MRTIVPIKKSPPYIGGRSVASVYELAHRDPEFAALWFKLQGRTVAFEDTLVAYAEKRAQTARVFAPVPENEPKRGRGRPRKTAAHGETQPEAA